MLPGSAAVFERCCTLYLGNWQRGSNVDWDRVHVDCDERDRGEDRDHLWPASHHNVSRAMLEAGRTIVVAAELQPLVYVLQQ